MKRILKSWPVMLIASLALSACQEKELDNPNEMPTPAEKFVIKLTPPSKTMNDGLGTEWVSGDKVNVFHAEAGSKNYVNDGAFEYVPTDEFEGVLGQELVPGQAYDWYVAYPYNEKMTSPEKMSIHIPAVQTQAADGSMAHLCEALCPLAGNAKGLASTAVPSVNMNHLVTVMKIKVTNYEANPCVLQRVSFCHTTDEQATARTTLGGAFTVDFSGETVSYAPVVSSDASVDISEWEENSDLTKAGTSSDYSRPYVSLETPKTLGLNESATVYLACLPFTIENATFLNIGMNSTDSGISQRICKVVSCKAGAINGIKQGSRLAPPFKNGINFYHGKKNTDGTYSIDNEGWWRCELPEGFDLQGSFDFRKLFTTVNADAKFEMIDKPNQNSTIQYYFDDFSACLETPMWNGDPNLNVNMVSAEDDRTGIFINSSAGYQVGSWAIFYREAETGTEDPVLDTESDMYDSYQGLVMAGYQGWHGTPGDGCPHNPAERWPHYDNTSGEYNIANSPFIFEPGVLRNGFDFWPDVTEYPVTYEAKGFTLPDGSTPRLYSSYDESTVDLHFSWMKEYGIDGVFMQRFVSQLTDPTALAHSDKVLESAMTASNVHARAISVMYDMVGMTSSTSASVIINDAAALKAKYNLDDRSKGQRYFLYHNGKPLIGLVSVGQASAEYSISQAQQIVNGLQDLGFSIMLGVPAYWREPGKGDCTSDQSITTLIQDVDIIMPWLVGVYDYDGTTGAGGGMFTNYFSNRIEEKKIGSYVYQQGDFTQAEKYNVEYCPLVFAGFSDRNIHPNNKVYDRHHGDFYWQQIHKFINKGAKMLYVAMFDEIDEGTAIYKCLRQNEVPSNTYGSDYYVVYANGAYSRSDSAESVSGSGNWCKKASELNVTFNGIENDLESDYYLWLTGQAGKVLKGEISLTETKPSR